MTEPVTTVLPTTLFRRFREVPATLSSQNGVLLAGMAYVEHGYKRAAGTGGIGQYVGSTLTAAWPNLGVNETVRTSTAVATIISAIVRYYTETGAPGATKGTQYGTAPNKITHNGTATIWTGAGFTPSLNVPLAVGDYVRLDNNGVTVLHTRVTGFEAIGGQLKVLVLADNIPAALTGVGVYFNVSVGQVATLDLLNSQLTTTSSQVTIPAALTAATSRTGSAYPVIGATLPDGTVLGQAYVDYFATLTGAFTGNVVKLKTATDVYATFPDTGVGSGLGFAALNALSPTVTGLQPAPVGVIAPTSDTLGGYQALIDVIRFRSDYSAIAVLSEDPSVIAAFADLLNSRASNYQPAQLFVGMSFTKDEEIGSSTAVTINDSQTPGEQRTFLVTAGAPFATAVSGDTIRHYTSPTVYVTYVIQSVISTQTAIVTSAVPGGPLAAQTIEVWHHLTTAEQVASAIGEAQSFANGSVNLIYPDTFTYGGVSVPPYMMAAYAAALQSWSAPQQMLSYVVPSSPWSAPTQAAVSGYQDELASGGLFVFDVSTSGVLYVRFPRTTDPSSDQTSQSVVVATEQFVTRYIASQLTPLLGLYRTSTELYAQLRTKASAALASLRNASVSGLGSIIISGTVGDIGRSTTNANTVVVPITVSIAGVAEDILQLDITVTLG